MPLIYAIIHIDQLFKMIILTIKKTIKYCMQAPLQLSLEFLSKKTFKV